MSVLVCKNVECRGFESHPRQLIFLRKNDCLGCAVLLCFVVCLTLLASFFHLSLKHVLFSSQVLDGRKVMKPGERSPRTTDSNESTVGIQ